MYCISIQNAKKRGQGFFPILPFSDKHGHAKSNFWPANPSDMTGRGTQTQTDRNAIVLLSYIWRLLREGEGSLHSVIWYEMLRGSKGLNKCEILQMSFKYGSFMNIDQRSNHSSQTGVAFCTRARISRNTFLHLVQGFLLAHSPHPHSHVGCGQIAPMHY